MSQVVRPRFRSSVCSRSDGSRGGGRSRGGRSSGGGRRGGAGGAKNHKKKVSSVRFPFPRRKEERRTHVDEAATLVETDVVEVALVVVVVVDEAALELTADETADEALEALELAELAADEAPVAEDEVPASRQAVELPAMMVTWAEAAEFLWMERGQSSESVGARSKRCAMRLTRGCQQSSR